MSCYFIEIRDMHRLLICIKPLDIPRLLIFIKFPDTPRSVIYIKLLNMPWPLICTKLPDTPRSVICIKLRNIPLSVVYIKDPDIPRSVIYIKLRILSTKFFRPAQSFLFSPKFPTLHNHQNSTKNTQNITKFAQFYAIRTPFQQNRKSTT